MPIIPAIFIKDKTYTLLTDYTRRGFIKANPQSASQWIAFKLKNIVALKGYDSPVGQNKLNMKFKFKRTIPQDEFLSLAKPHLDKFGYKVVDIRSGEVRKLPVPAKEVIKKVTAPLRAGLFLAKNAKWIAIGGIGLAGLFYIRPFLPFILPKRR